MRIRVFALLLLAMQWMARIRLGTGRPLGCCLKVSDRKVPVDHIMKYTMERRPLCPVTAVRFSTIKKITICSDPESSWARKAICVVDRRTNPNRAEQSCRDLTINGIRFTATTPISITRKKTDTGLTCCLNVSSIRVPFEQIMDYSLQDRTLCPITAVRFLTEKGNIICSDPESIWVKEVICEINRQRNPNRANQICRGLTVNRKLPTVTTPVSMTRKKTAGTEASNAPKRNRIETATAVKVADYSLMTSPSHNDRTDWSVDYAEEKETLSSTTNDKETTSSGKDEESPNKNTMFCIKS